MFSVVLFFHQRVGAVFLAPEILALDDQLALTCVAGGSHGQADIDSVEPRVAGERSLREEAGIIFFVFMVALLMLMLVLAFAPVARLAVEQIPAEPHRGVAANIPADPRIEGARLQPVVRTAEQRCVVAPKKTAAEFGVELVAVGVLLVQIAEGPERPARLHPHPFRQPGAGQGLDIGLLELDLRILPRVRAETEGQGAPKLVVDIARSRHLAMAEGEALRRALRLVTDREARYRRFFGRESRIPAVQDDADRRVERVVLRWPAWRRWLRGRAHRLRLERRKLRFQRLQPRLVIPFQGLNFRRQRRGARRRRRLGHRLGAKHRPQQRG